MRLPAGTCSVPAGASTDAPFGCAGTRTTSTSAPGRGGSTVRCDSPRSSWRRPARGGNGSWAEVRSRPSAGRSRPLAEAGRRPERQGAWPPEDGGGSLPGTPSSRTCSVHSVPDQYRCSCLTKGSVNHPAGVPVVLLAAGLVGGGVGADPGGEGCPTKNEGGACGRRGAPFLRPDASARSAISASGTRTMNHEPWPYPEYIPLQCTAARFGPSVGPRAGRAGGPCIHVRRRSASYDSGCGERSATAAEAEEYVHWGSTRGAAGPSAGRWHG